MTAIILGAFGPTEFILIAAVVVIMFGGKKIPSLMKGIGQGIREFKDAKDGKPANEETPVSGSISEKS
jgi:sec-independent protein translocase protein TatA